MSFARRLRNNATPAELELWHVLSTVRPRFTRQLKLGPFVADFACRRAQVLVEVDGSQHVESVRDEQRTKLLEREGWRVVRCWNQDVFENREGVIELILASVAERLPEGESVEFVEARAGRERRPRSRLDGGKNKKGHP